MVHIDVIKQTVPVCRDMRPRVSWMTGNDDSILEYLHEKDVALPPAPLHYNLERSGYSVGYSTVRRRLQLLEEHGLVKKEKEKEGYYGITDKGRNYLVGELEAEELEETDWD